jgi:hypothetical protein
LGAFISLEGNLLTAVGLLPQAEINREKQSDIKILPGCMSFTGNRLNGSAAIKKAALFFLRSLFPYLNCLLLPFNSTFPPFLQTLPLGVP